MKKSNLVWLVILTLAILGALLVVLAKPEIGQFQNGILLLFAGLTAAIVGGIGLNKGFRENSLLEVLLCTALLIEAGFCLNEARLALTAESSPQQLSILDESSILQNFNHGQVAYAGPNFQELECDPKIDKDCGQKEGILPLWMIRSFVWIVLFIAFVGFLDALRSPEQRFFDERNDS